jgi:spore germination protein KB
MPKEIISSKQAIAIIVMFLFGSSVVLGVNSELCQDTWLGLLVSVIMFVPLFIIYSRIMKLYPQKDIFIIIDELFGKVIGKIFTILMSWYALHLGALVLRNFSEFIQVVSMNETPEVVLMIAMIIIVIYLAKSGIEVLGRWAIVAFVIIIISIIVTLMFTASKADFNNLLPIFNHSPKEILSSAYSILSFPFAETILFTTIVCTIPKKDSPYKIYLYGTLLALIIFIVIITRNIAISGAPSIKASYFPSYSSARLIGVGDFLTRIEGSITINFILAGITKITVCLFAAAKGIAHLFKVTNYRSLITPAGFLMVALCSILYSNITEMFAFLPTYSIYAIPFQIIIPVIIWITAEIKKKKKKLIEA